MLIIQEVFYCQCYSLIRVFIWLFCLPIFVILVITKFE